MTLGVLLVGVGGNNGSTFVASLLAHRHKITWKSHSGEILNPDWLGSTIMMGSTDSGDRLFERFQFANPLDIKVGGWDISGMNMSEAVRRAAVLNWQIEEQLRPVLQEIKPWKAVYNRDFIAMNQETRADNIYPHEMPLRDQLENIRRDIRDFKTGVDNCIVLWTANTERMLKDVPENLF
jgi:myo-inositol-1-phosphate synthase